MAESGNEAPTSEGQVYPINWNGEDWARIKEAARIRTEQEHYRITPADIIRQGTMRRVEEILGAAEAAA